MEYTLELVAKIKRSTYDKERYETDKDYILKYRKIDNFYFWRENIILAGKYYFGGKFFFWK